MTDGYGDWGDCKENEYTGSCGCPSDWGKQLWERNRDQIIKGQPASSEPKGGKATWAGRKIPVETRNLSPVDPETRSVSPGKDYLLPKKTKHHPPARLSPSSMEGRGEVVRVDQVGERIPIIGNPDMDVVGNVIHSFFAEDRPEFDDQHRLDLAAGIIKRWNISFSGRLQNLNWALSTGLTFHNTKNFNLLLLPELILQGFAKKYLWIRKQVRGISEIMNCHISRLLHVDFNPFRLRAWS